MSTEIQTVKRLIDLVLAEGKRARWDFEDKFTDKRETLVNDADASDIQTLIVEQTGSFVIIYGNDPDGSEVIADYTDNEFCNRIYREVYDS